jgi:hypothetical protein
MMDTMMDIGGPSGDFIKTGASLSSFGSTGYGLLWSIATIVVFWKAAFWALKGSSADGLIQKIQGGAEKAGGFLARAGTVDREFFPMPGKGGTQKVAVSNLFKTMTSGVATMHRNRMNQDYNELTGPEGFNLFNKELTETTKAIDEFKNKVSSLQTPDKQKETNKYFENKGFKTLLDNYESVNKGVLTNSGFTDAELKPLRDAAAKGNGNVEDVEKAFRKLLESKNLTPAASYSGKPADETKPTTGASTDSSYTIVNAETTDARKITLKNGDAEEATFTDIDKVKTY